MVSLFMRSLGALHLQRQFVLDDLLEENERSQGNPELWEVRLGQEKGAAVKVLGLKNGQG